MFSGPKPCIRIIQTILHSFLHFSRANGCNTSSVHGNTKENFSRKSEKMNVKFHKNCDTGKILKISCVGCNFVKFNIHFLGLP